MKTKDKPLYLEIYESISSDIKNGKLKPNDKLISKRNMANKLGVSLITVENAYDQLLSEGYIYSIEKKGYYINNIEIYHSNKSNKESINEKIIKTYKYDFTSTNNLNNKFPYSSYNKIIRKIINIDNIFKDSSYKGSEELRKAISKHLNSYLGLNVSYKQIIIGSGSENLYSLLINFFSRDIVYGLEDPGYLSISNIYNLNDVKYKYIPLDDKGIDISVLNKSNIDVVHISTNHHYPSGISMPINRRYEILKWANENNSYIIEDDYDMELRLKGKPIPPLYDLDNNDRVIYLNTFSITISSNIRIAYMVLPKGLLNKYEDKMSVFKCGVPTLDQLILAEFINSGSFERLLNRKKKYYREIKDTFLSLLSKDKIIQELELKEADLGLHLLIKYPYKIKDKEVEDIANKLDIKIYTLSHFSYDKKDSHTLLIKYTSFNLDNVYDYTSVLIKLLKKIKSFSYK